MKRDGWYVATVIGLCLVLVGIFAWWITRDDGKHPTTPAVTNPWMPLTPATYTYVGVDENGEPSRTVTVVTDQRRTIAGVSATQIHDTVYAADGSIAEDTLDWYATDSAGNVWYYGEDTREYDHGKVTSTAGTWLAGQNGAQQGIVMQAHPVAGQSYDQENAVDAKDHASVVSVEPLVIEETTPLEPGTAERKTYIAGVGQVSTVTTQGDSQARSQLVEVRRGNQ